VVCDGDDLLGVGFVLPWGGASFPFAMYLPDQGNGLMPDERRPAEINPAAR
jgi:hypothetical protein